jgi:hypothetical protein
VFLAVRAPKLFVKQFTDYGGGSYYRHALKVLEGIGEPIPDIVKKAIVDTK